MMPTRATRPDSAEKTVRDIRRATRRQYSAEEKIRIVLEGLRGETSIAELCRKEGIAQSMYYGWSTPGPNIYFWHWNCYTLPKFTDFLPEERDSL
jgi:transposase